MNFDPEIDYFPGDIVLVLRPLGQDHDASLTLHDNLDPAELRDLLPNVTERKMLSVRLWYWLGHLCALDEEQEKKTTTVYNQPRRESIFERADRREKERAERAMQEAERALKEAQKDIDPVPYQSRWERA